MSKKSTTIAEFRRDAETWRKFAKGRPATGSTSGAIATQLAKLCDHVAHELAMRKVLIERIEVLVKAVNTLSRGSVY